MTTIKVYEEGKIRREVEEKWTQAEKDAIEEIAKEMKRFKEDGIKKKEEEKKREIDPKSPITHSNVS